MGNLELHSNIIEYKNRGRIIILKWALDEKVGSVDSLCDFQVP
jgi:hypothetical protein